MNNRLLASGAAAMFSTITMGGPSAIAEGAPVCQAVYDETALGTVDSGLALQIERLYGEGVSVHIQVLGTETSEDLLTIGAIQSYQDRVAAECNFPDSASSIDVTIDEETSKYRVADEGDHGMTNGQPSFEAALKDKATPFQDDVAHLLESASGSNVENFKHWFFKEDGWMLTAGGVAGAMGALAILRVASRPRRSGSGGPRGSGGGNRSGGGTLFIYSDSTGYGSGDDGSFGGDF